MLRAATALVSAASLTMLSAPAGAWAKPGWGKPFRLTAPYATDLTAVNLAMNPRGDAAAVFSVQDQDRPATSDPFVAIRAVGGGVSPTFAVAGAQMVLDLAYDGSGLRLLTGTSESGNACCSTVLTQSLLRNGRFGRASTLIGKLAGATVGSLTPLSPGGLLATVATDSGVWVAQSSPGGGFGPTRRLTGASAMPWTAATAAAHGQTAVAWTETKGQQGEIAPGTIYLAGGSGQAAPGGSHPAFTVPAGHAVDNLGLAASAGGFTAAWIESWFDSGGSYRAETVVSDVRRGARRAVFSLAGQAASGLVFSGDARGDEVLAWRSCARSGSCTLRAVVRPAGRRFGSPQSLGPIEPGQPPAAAVAPNGDTLVGWIASGQVYAAERRPGGGRLGTARTVSSTSFASNLALAFGPSRTALAAWTQGTFAPDVVGAVFRR